MANTKSLPKNYNFTRYVKDVFLLTINGYFLRKIIAKLINATLNN